MDYEPSDDSEENEDDSFPHFEPELPPAARMDATPMDREMRSLQLVAHLRRPFGAPLFTLTSTRRPAVAYRRLGVAVDSIITMQMQEDVFLADLLGNVRILDVL